MGLGKAGGLPRVIGRHRAVRGHIGFPVPEGQVTVKKNLSMSPIYIFLQTVCYLGKDLNTWYSDDHHNLRYILFDLSTRYNNPIFSSYQAI